MLTNTFESTFAVNQKLQNFYHAKKTLLVLFAFMGIVYAG